jgi:anti-sigma-K factor RskA
MNAAPDNPELIDRLAAEYVLGTLRGGARRRFERWRNTSQRVDERCRFWEERLMPLLRGVEPLRPPPGVWQGIRRRLDLPSAAPRRSSSRTWAALAASIALIVALGALLYWRIALTSRAAAIATIAAPSGTLLWQIEIYGHGGEAGRLTVRAGALTAPPTGRDYELWALPRAGAPVSLGVLPYRDSTARRALTIRQQQALARSTQLAVSVEPPGGSRTGAPTGAVVFVVSLRALS